MKKIFTLVAAVLATVSLSAVTYTPDPGENTIQPLIAGLADGDTIVLANGDYTEWSTLDFTTKVTFIAAEGAKVSLGIYDLEIQNDFEMNGVDVHNISVDNYLFRVSAAVAGTIAFKNCSMKVNTAETITTATPYIYVEVTGLGTLIIDNCTFSDNTKSQGSVVYAGTKTISNFTMKNSTVYGCPKQSVYCESIVTSAVVDHCTFYNTGAEILYIKKSGETATCEVTNCIFTNAENTTSNCIKTYFGSVTKCIYYNLGEPRSGVTITDCSKADPLFVDPAKGDFNLQKTSPAIGAATDKSNLGDPRWTVYDPTSIVSAKAAQNSKKIMVNGQMVIVREGEQYNVLGTKF